ncbi:MAG: nucleotidyltransferase domain-containing protein [Desulfobacterales bacterium]|nr:nucleotidyltransferase domain-containing protein [Desulfobacterales bacterium]
MEHLIRNCFSKKPEVIAVYLFGSQEAGKQRPDSDVDIGYC